MRVRSLAIVFLMYMVAVWCHDSDFFERKFEEVLDKAIERTKKAIKTTKDTDKKKREEGVDTVSKIKTGDIHTLFASPIEEISALADAAHIQLAVTGELITADNLDIRSLKTNRDYLRIWQSKFRKYLPKRSTRTVCDPNAYYRTADGSCNNLEFPILGAMLCPEARELSPLYDDNVGAPRIRGRQGLLSSARAISNALHKVEGKSPRNEKLTSMVMQWGQFIDHDIVATPVLKGEMGANIECCGGTENENRTQCFPIRIPDNDPYFNKTCMNFVRSAPVPNQEPGFREHMNQVTSYIDGSAIYGSKLEDTMSLRAKIGGLLKTLDDNYTQGMLPANTNDKCTLVEPVDHCQRAGDARVNVLPSLGWSHTAFLRQHNRIATQLAEINSHWNDETLFQQTRRIIAAIEQIISYNEYLPAILNEDTINKYQLTLNKNGYGDYYRKDINPTIANVFAAAAFRFGHSQIANYQALMNKQYQIIEKKPIESTYLRPHMITQDNGIGLDAVARWLTADPTPLADGLFEDGVRNKLFLDNAGNSLDLPALNIQRGRDHGIPSYNHWRSHCKLDNATMSDKGEFILPDHTDDETRKFVQVYGHVDDIDLFPGAMTETLLPNSSVGPTFACLIGKQFGNLKKGDRYWHESLDEIIRFEEEQLQELRKITLARVICDNFNIDKLQPNVFRVPGPGNERVECDQLPEMNLTKWKACGEFLSDGRPNFIQQ